MTGAARQLTFDLPHRPAQGAEDFFVSASNAAAVDLIDRWPDWQHWAALVVGPQGAGKSHLAHVWQRRSGAATVTGDSLGEDAIGALQTSRALVVEDIDRGIADQKLLFHLLNVAREHKLSILLTSRQAPGELDIALPDLRSRLRAAPLIRIEAPDEALLRAVLVKLFADRQLTVEPHVIEYIALHIERSMQAANDVVAVIDRTALALQRRVTRAVAAAALQEIQGGGDA